MTSRQRQGRQTATYRDLIGIAEEVVVNARTAAARASLITRSPRPQ
jgi:hypothetical protein